MFGFDVIALSGLMLLASGRIECSIPKPPQVVIAPYTNDVEYDFSKTSAELGAFETNTTSPYAVNLDTATGGLRYDKPEIKLEVKWGVKRYPHEELACLWYDSVKLQITLSPIIYLAKENNYKGCREAILDHELKHVKTDRRVINNYSQRVGQDLQDAVNKTGAIGPYHLDEVDAVQKQLVDIINQVVKTHEKNLYEEMNYEQGKIDTLEEYERVNNICRQAAVKLSEQR